MIPMKCSRESCGYVWAYNGNSDHRICCPKCLKTLTRSKCLITPDEYVDILCRREVDETHARISRIVSEGETMKAEQQRSE
jgi:hypothetical protein